MHEEKNEKIFTIHVPNSRNSLQPSIKIVDLSKLNTLNQAWEKYANNKKETILGKTEVKVMEEDEVSICYIFYGAFILIACIVMSSFFILIPQHNVIEQPEFWYESLFINIFGWWTIFSAQKVLDAGMILGCPQIISWKNITNLFLAGSFTVATFHCILYLLWSKVLHFNFPMPGHSLVSGYLTAFVIMVRLWFIFPKHVRRNPIFRSQLKYFFCYILWTAVAIYLQLSVVMTKVFTQIPANLQWTMAIFVPLIKNFDDSVSKYLIGKASGPDIVASRTVINIFSSATFSFWLVIMLGTTATDFTSFCVLGVNSVINAGLCIKTIKLQKKVTDENKGKEASQNALACKETLGELIINEIIELVVPFAFVCTYTIAYYGPNAPILGNIGNDYWHFRKVEEILPLIKWAFIICLIDFISTLVTGMMLWKYCRIHLMREVLSVLKKYGYIIAIHAAINVNKVIKSYYRS